MSTLSQIEHDAIRLQAMIEAIDVVHDLASVAGDGVDVAQDVRRARNSLPALIEAAHAASEAILKDLGQLASDERQAARGRECAQ